MTAVKLVRVGEVDVIGDIVNVDDGDTSIATTFNLVGKPKGLWDVVLEYPGNIVATLDNGFSIEAGRDAELWTDIIGLGLIRPGRARSYLFSEYGTIGDPQ